MNFASGSVEGIATVVAPVSGPVTRGVVLAHGGSEDGRHCFESEAAALASRGAAVVLPVARIRLDGGIEGFASDVRNAVLTQRAALDLLIESGAPPDHLAFVGHSAGGAQAAILSGVEPRLSRIAILGNGAGPTARAALAQALSQGDAVTSDLVAVTEWFDLAHFVGADRRARLLIQHGRRDPVVPLEAAQELFRAAAQPTTWAEYDCDHGLDAHPRARDARAEFLLR
ncbi:MAG TPA: hypothetical protein VHC49_01225 [Mycobacteriales bacterium]|nr:hypothetical protein [Mycobacteriales bacterium]